MTRIQLSGKYAGPATRVLTNALDSSIVVFSFGLVVGLGGFVLGLGSNIDIDLNSSSESGWALGLGLWWVVYHWTGIAIVGRTPACSLTGLRIVSQDGAPLGTGRALIRVLTYPLSFLTLGIGFLMMLGRSDRQTLHDFLAKSVVVYDWGDRPAELPDAMSEWVKQQALR